MFVNGRIGFYYRAVSASCLSRVPPPAAALPTIRFFLYVYMKMVHKASMASIEPNRCIDAAVLIQSYTRRSLSVVEASERRRLRNQQVEVAAGFRQKPPTGGRILAG